MGALDAFATSTGDNDTVLPRFHQLRNVGMTEDAKKSHQKGQSKELVVRVKDSQVTGL